MIWLEKGLFFNSLIVAYSKERDETMVIAISIVNDPINFL